MHLKHLISVVGALALSSSLAACGSSEAKSAESGFGKCKITSEPNTIKLDTVTDGTLTVANSLPSIGWFNGTTPESIDSGYEYCMAAELANMAGLKSVKVADISFDSLVAGNGRGYDLALTESNITPERAKVVDFSVPYYDETIGVLVKKGEDVTESNVASKACGVQLGTTTPDFAKNEIGCEAKVYPDLEAIIQGLRSGQIDTVVGSSADIFAQAHANKELDVVGQYETGEQMGAIYPKRSTNRTAFDEGITAMIEDGTLDGLSEEYLAPAFGVDPNSVPIWNAK